MPRCRTPIPPKRQPDAGHAEHARHRRRYFDSPARVEDQRLGPAAAPVAPDPFTSTDPSTLLGGLRTSAPAIPAVQSRAIAHRLTGRVLNAGGTLGIARSAAPAAPTTEFLSRQRPPGRQRRAGHGARNRSQPGRRARHHGLRRNVLTRPEYSWTTTPVFSQCSLDEIRPFIASHRGSCVTSPQYGDAEIRIPPIAQPGLRHRAVRLAGVRAFGGHRAAWSTPR